MPIKENREDRPDPSLLLSQIEADERRQKRGKLKIFFGSSAGAGKTYAMLAEAHRLKKEGVDVLAGIIETHGRHETEELLRGLPQLPRREINHRGVVIHEFDLDEALKRKPALLLVDELAHTNAPGSRHPKRWQDIEELLSAGIDVYTTVNVQHLESLNDVIGSVTGIPVRETVPDTFFDDADEVTLVDTPPDEILKRLKEGKVYIAPGANERAVQNFFKKTNLLSLRELALRRTAEYVDADTDEYRERQGLAGNTAGDKILVCVGPDIFAAKLVRTGKRLAAAHKASWTALYIEKPGHHDERLRQHVHAVLQSAERNGAHIVTLQSAHIGDEIIAYARRKGITKIIIGKSLRPRWQEMFRLNLTEFILHQSGDVDVYVVTTPATLSAAFNLKKSIQPPRLWGLDYLLTAAVIAACTAVGFYLKEIVFSNIDVIMLYLVGAVAVATWLGRGPALLYSALVVGCFNYFFTEPLYTFNVHDSRYWLTFIVMFFASFVVSTLAARLREQVSLSRRREHETQMLYTLTRELTSVATRTEMSAALIESVAESIGAAANIWYPDAGGPLLQQYGNQVGDPLKEQTVAQWAFDHAIPAGLGTDTMPSAACYYIPVIGTRATLGVVGIFPRDEERSLLPDQIVMLQSFAGLLASAIERVEAANASEKAQVLAEKERLRNTLLSSVSHDLRSPLSAITGAADTLLQTQKNDLLVSIRQEAFRLTRIVNNLLDITRIEGGQLKLNMTPYDPSEIIGAAIESCRDKLKDCALVLSVPGNLPFIKMDGLLVSQLIQNLLENAAHHTPVGTEVAVHAEVKEGCFRMSVSDNGPGIPQGQEKEIFNKFATFSYGDKPKGTGLGLAISQAIAAAHHGRIWAENRKEGGARFVFELPSELIIRESR